MFGSTHPVFRYSAAFAAVALALCLYLLFPALDSGSYLLFLAAVELAFWLGGEEPGLLAVALSAIALGCGSLPTAGSRLAVFGRLLQIGLFCLVAGITTLLGARRKPRPIAQKDEDIQTGLRQQAEQVLRSSEEHFRQLAEHIEGVIWLADLRLAELIYVSPAYETIWGRSCASLYANPRSFVEAVHPEDRERVAQSMLEEPVGERFHEDFRIVRPDGSVRWVSVRSFPIRDEQGQPYRLAGITVDITARKQGEERLAYQAQLLNEVNDAVIAADRQQCITSWNRAAEQMYGWLADEVLGKVINQVVAVRLPHSTREQVLREVLEHGTWRGEAEHWSREGRKIIVDWSIAVIRNMAGEITGTVAINRDITQLKESQRLAVQAERLAAIGQVVASIIHESGSALQGIQACLERLTLRLQDQPVALDLVDRAQKEQDRLLRLYEDVRSYAAPIRLQLRECHLAEVWRAAWEQSAERRANRQAVLVEETGGIDLSCWADPFRLEQVLRNIFDNALDACTDPVRIEIRCTEAKLDERPAICIAVRDNGPQLPSEQRQKIFEPFYTTKTRGIGLGLPISRQLIEAHEGRITVGDGTGRGVEILITLPRREP